MNKLAPLVVVLAVLWTGAVTAAANEAFIQKAGAGRHALLVGCTFYPNLDKKFHLRGPANDVVVFKKMLGELFAFPADNITALSEADGKARGDKHLPTRANIEREFKRLAKVVKEGDKVVIMMAGHGSQQPERENAADPESDGMDEIFLPRDVGEWDGGAGSIANAIVDNELGQWLQAIRKKGAFVWIIIDACHSGTMIRGADSEVSRAVSPQEGLKIPKDAILAAQKRARERSAKTPEKARGDLPPVTPFKVGEQSGIVAIYAAQSTEVTVEREMPPRSSSGQVYGLLGYTLCQTLMQASKNSSKPLTYQELIQNIYSQYSGWGRVAPTPVIEGADRDREVLGDKVWAGRSRVQLSQIGRSFKINAGAVQGLTQNSILAVFPPPGEGDKLQGHVRISKLGALESVVEPCAFDKIAVNSKVPEGGVCEVVQIDYGDQRIRVAVDPLDARGKPIETKVAKVLTDMLQSLANEKGAILERAAEVKQADWLLRMKDGELALIPGSGLPATAAPLAVPMKSAEAGLRKMLAQIARAEALKKLAAGTGGGVPVDVEIRRCKNLSDKVGEIPASWSAAGVALKDGDFILVRAANAGRMPIDVTVLNINSQYGIECLFPRDGEENRLRAGESTPPLQAKVLAKNASLEHLVVIAVKGDGLAMDFGFLEQPSLDKARALKTTQKALDSSLGKLLQNSLYGSGTSRSLTSQDMNGLGVRMVPWRVAAREEK